MARIFDFGIPIIALFVGRPLLLAAGDVDEEVATAAVIPLALALYWVYETALTARSGQTWGKRLAGVRVTNLEGERPELWRCAVRALPVVLIGINVIWLLAPAAYLWAFFSPDARGLHDLTAGTRVESVSLLPRRERPAPD